MKPIEIQPASLLAGAGIALTTVLALGLNRPEEGRADELVVRRLVVLDEDGRPRIVLGQDAADTERRSRHVGLTLHDPDGSERFGLGVTEDGGVTMGFDAPRGVGSAMPDRLALSVDADGRAAVMLINNRTEVPLRLFVDESGAGHLEFLGDYDAEARRVRVRGFGLDGESESHLSLDSDG